MSTMKLNQFEKNLNTRELGIQARELLDMELLNNDIVIIDFEGIELATNSFIDELLCKKIKEIGFDDFKDKVKVKNVANNIMPIIIENAMNTITEELDAKGNM